MVSDADQTDTIAAQIREADAGATPLSIRGGGTKSFYGRVIGGAPLSLAGHRGVLNYQPTELTLTARAGTPLHEIELILADRGQMLAFEPPHFATGSTLGGAVAAGLSGPRRPFAGAVRDHVLGIRMVDGHGTVERFGGEVIKNVAGYDVSRLMTGALGTLGVLLEVSVKVLPRPAAELSICLDEPPERLHERVEAALRAGAPVTGAAHDGARARVRLTGAASAVDAGAARLGGEVDEDADFWSALRDQRLPFFTAEPEKPLWRIALPPGAPLPALPGPGLLDWAGQLCWLRSDEPAERIRAEAAAAGGHATRFRAGHNPGTEPVFTPLDPVLLRLHQRLKQAFDPAGILNPGRMYAGF